MIRPVSVGLKCHVNNLPDCVSEGEAHLYADDTTAYVIGDGVWMKSL